MSVEANGAAAPEAIVVMNVDDDSRRPDNDKPTGLHSPPESNNAMTIDGSDSELSDLEDAVADQIKQEADAAQASAQAQPPPVEVEDIGEVLPDHWSGTVPVFKPTMKQFKDFKVFMEKVDEYGMRSGIIKIIPPAEWKDSLPRRDELVKQIRIREPIKQDIMGHNGTYRQVNILHQRAYNLPQWRQLCDQSEHQPPARRGERRANADKPKPATRATRSSAASTPKPSPSTPTPKKAKRGRPRKIRKEEQEDQEQSANPEERPMTPVSPRPEKDADGDAEKKPGQEAVVTSIENDPGVKVEDECDEPVIRRMGFSRQAKPKIQSTSARRKYVRREGSAMIDEAAFKDWDYEMDISDYTPERCEELERVYWKTLTYAPPLYGADLLGTLFDEKTEIWNLNKLPNLLDVLGTKVPGVNTAYLYLGMWKATFAWHLEDVDLYSINYLHFGAPKQWYSISQADARRFEAAMKSIWPQEAKACDQFLRHKAFLISPAYLKQHFNITVNKCVSYPGEFVVTYPYGYHSGYNLGYNCAEAVNFALDSWLAMGKIAKKCECAQAQDSVWVDVYEIERKLRGESTDYEETDDEDEEDEDEDEEDTGLPSPPSSHTVRVKAPGRKRKRAAGDKDGKPRVKKIRLGLKTPMEPPCCLCPNDIPGAQILPTDDGRKAHRMCALYIPETYIETVGDREIVANVAGIDKARMDLKCLYCRSKKGACFQCSQKKCARSYHATCAAAAGVFIEDEEVPVIGEDGIEYKEQAFEFSCRFHRIKRDRKYDGDALAENPRIRAAAAALKKGEICQMQYYRGDIFAGVVVENRLAEESVLLDIIPKGDRVEVEWKWLLLPDPSEYRLPKASPNAIPMPTTRKAQRELNAKRRVDDTPRKDDTFLEGYTWAEFSLGDRFKNPEQTKVNFSKEDQIWYYLGKPSTEVKAQYTGDVSRPEHDPKSNFLASIPKPLSMPPPRLPKKSSVTFNVPPQQGISQSKAAAPRPDKPYVYKPRVPVGSSYSAQFTTQAFASVPQGAMSGSSFQGQPGNYLPIQGQSQAFSQAQVQPRSQPPKPSRTKSQQLQQPQAQTSQQSTMNPNHLHFGTDPQFKGSSSSSAFNSTDRFAPVGGSNGFPQLPGLTWPPAHMTSGQNSSRVWSSSTLAGAPGPNSIPMTSSALSSLPNSSSPAGAVVPQQPISTYQKYSFFHVHHNREPSRYRTPYAPWGGFTNGYEGNLQMFLKKARLALAGENAKTKTTSGSHARTPSGGTGRASQIPASSPSTRLSQTSPLNPMTPSMYNTASSAQTSPAGSFEIKEPGSAPLHPAIRPQYGAAWSQETPSPSNPRNSWTPPSVTPSVPSGQRIPFKAPTPTPSKAPGIPSYAKKSASPIPLPSYARTAVSSKTNGRGSPLSRPPQVNTESFIDPALTMDPAAMRVSPITPVNDYHSTSYSPQYQSVAPSALHAPMPAGSMGPPPLPALAPSASHPQQPQYFNPPFPMESHTHQQQWNNTALSYGNAQPPPTPVNQGLLQPAPGDASFIEQMLFNLKRASGQGAPPS